MATYTVTTLADENDVNATVGSPGGTGLSLREAIALANAGSGGDTIIFDPTLAGGTVRLSNAGTLSITKSLTINGDINGDGRPDITISGDVNGDDNHVAGSTVITDIAASLSASKLSDNVGIFHDTGGDFHVDGLVLTGGNGSNARCDRK